MKWFLTSFLHLFKNHYKTSGFGLRFCILKKKHIKQLVFDTCRRQPAGWRFYGNVLLVRPKPQKVHFEISHKKTWEMMGNAIETRNIGGNDAKFRIRNRLSLDLNALAGKLEDKRNIEQTHCPIFRPAWPLSRAN